MLTLCAAAMPLAAQPRSAAPPRAPQADAPTAFPPGFMKSITEYGAKGDGTSDDTAAIQAALDDERRNADGTPTYGDYFGRPRALYFPPGTYLVRDTLDWVGCCMTLQGAGPGATQITLKDGAPGFGDPDVPRPVVFMPNGNKSFRQNIFNLTINTGKNNAGAIGIDYISNNRGALDDVVIRSGDGRGHAGLSMTRAWPGPLLIKDVQIDGFDYGIDVAHSEYGPTFENLTLTNQTVAAIRNNGNTLAIHTLRSQNRVPAIQNTSSSGMVILLDGQLDGGTGNTSAIQNAGHLYLRDVASSGYRSVVQQGDTPVDGTMISEYVSGDVRSLFDSPGRSLGLPIRETPDFHDSTLDNWAAVTCSGYAPSCAVASQLQQLLDSGASTVYFPFGTRQVYNQLTVTVPASVRRIIGFDSVVNGGGTNGGGIVFRVAAGSSTPLIIERFGYGVKVAHASGRTVVLKHGGFAYTAEPGAGDVFFEDAGLNRLAVQPRQHVWARQLNIESLDSPRTKITNDGGTLWILGMKTEGKGPVIETRGGGFTEFLGTLIYPVRASEPNDNVPDAAFINRESSHSLVFSLNTYKPEHRYEFLVDETRDGVRRQLPTKNAAERMPLYVGYKAASTPQPPPVVVTGKPAAWLPLVVGRR